MKKKWRILRNTLLVVGVFLLAQALSYILVARVTMPAAMAQLLSWMRAAGCGDFVCVSADTWNSLSPASQRALDRALSRCFKTIYHAEGEIPRDRIDGLGQLNGGCIIRWELHSDCVFWFTATSSGCQIFFR